MAPRKRDGDELRVKGRIDPDRLREAILGDGGLPPPHFLLTCDGNELICAWDSGTFETAIEFDFADQSVSKAVRKLLRSEGLAFETMAAAVAHARSKGWPDLVKSERNRTKRRRERRT